MFIHQYPSSSLNFGPCIHAHRPSTTDQGWLRRLCKMVVVEGSKVDHEVREGKKTLGRVQQCCSQSCLAILFFFQKKNGGKMFLRSPKKSLSRGNKFEGPSLMLLASSLGRLLFPDSWGDQRLGIPREVWLGERLETLAVRKNLWFFPVEICEFSKKKKNGVGSPGSSIFEYRWFSHMWIRLAFVWFFGAKTPRCDSGLKFPRHEGFIQKVWGPPPLRPKRDVQWSWAEKNHRFFWDFLEAASDVAFCEPEYRILHISQKLSLQTCLHVANFVFVQRSRGSSLSSRGLRVYLFWGKKLSPAVPISPQKWCAI